MQNDTYEIKSDYHRELIEKFIPLAKGKSIKDEYDKCNLKIFETGFLNKTELSEQSNNFTLTKCNQWVYSKKYFDQTLITKA